MNTDYSARREELILNNVKEFCLKFLGSPLVIDTDYEVEKEGDPPAYKTEDNAFFFVPQLEDPVMSGRTLLGQHPIPGRYHYSVEIMTCDGGSYWEPPDYDQVEIERADSLSNAIAAAAHWILDQQLDGYREGEYWNMEAILEKEFPNPLD
jgi:hypothetical protein